MFSSRKNNWKEALPTKFLSAVFAIQRSSNWDFNIDSKSQLRKSLRQKRRQLSRQQQSVAAANLDRQFARSHMLKRNSTVALYMANDGEIDPRIILHRLLKRKIHCYLPIIKRNNTLQFGRYKKGDKLVHNRFSIAEPTRKKQSLKPKNINFVFLPLVAFDRSGARLGMGGGFYDKSFAFLSDQKKKRSFPHSTCLVGLAHQCQEVAAISEDDWDIPLSWIMTDQELIEVQ